MKAAVIGVGHLGKRHARILASLPGISLAGAPLDRYSFPSGHTLHAVAFTWQACAAFPELSVVLVPLAYRRLAERLARINQEEYNGLVKLAHEKIDELPVVEDLPVLLKKIHAMKRGDAPFSARSYYDEDGKLVVEFSR